MSEPKITIDRVHHIGIRVTDTDKALAFYEALGFEFKYKVPYDAVTIMKNEADVELNLITNGVEVDGGNILMDVPDKYPGYTHVALRVRSIRDVIDTLKRHDIAISQGPVQFGESEEVSVFVRDPDRNVVELRGNGGGLTEEDGLESYKP